MHLDPAYALAVRGDAPLAELTERERELLRGVDPRALTVDRFRRARAVTALIEEYPVTAAIAGVAAVDRFFSSPAFRACVFDHGSMAMSFGTWLDDQAGGPGRIEAAMARVRRPAAPAGAGVACSPRIVPLLVIRDSLAVFERQRAALGADPAAALASGRFKRQRLPRGTVQEALIIEADAAGEVSIALCTRELVQLLQFVAVARPEQELVAEAARLGDPGDDNEALVAGLVADGLLVRV